jgi:hypothetical protein
MGELEFECSEVILELLAAADAEDGDDHAIEARQVGRRRNQATTSSAFRSGGKTG